MSVYKTAGPHNPLLGPAVCLCVECSRIVLTLRCPARSPGGAQCGDYKGHRGQHNLIVATVFSIAEDRAGGDQ